MRLLRFCLSHHSQVAVPVPSWSSMLFTFSTDYRPLTTIIKFDSFLLFFHCKKVLLNISISIMISVDIKWLVLILSLHIEVGLIKVPFNVVEFQVQWIIINFTHPLFDKFPRTSITIIMYSKRIQIKSGTGKRKGCKYKVTTTITTIAATATT